MTKEAEIKLRTHITAFGLSLIRFEVSIFEVGEELLTPFSRKDLTLARTENALIPLPELILALRTFANELEKIQ